VTGLEDGLFPSSRTFMDPKELEEERRLMYVAMTRAKKELYLSRASERFQYGDYIRNPASRFLKEISPDFLQEYDMSNLMPKSFFGNSFGVADHPVESTFKIKKTIIENDVSEFRV
jgi:DNA helicase-2/ATP-dependent DNA helicase PcrA